MCLNSGEDDAVVAETIRKLYVGAQSCICVLRAPYEVCAVAVRRSTIIAHVFIFIISACRRLVAGRTWS